MSNPAYQVLIQSVNSSDPAESVSVRAPIPRNFLFDTSASFEAPFSRGLSGNSAVDTMLKVVGGARVINQMATAQIWQGSSETELSLEIELHAENDPYKEVRLPVLQLMGLVTPSSVGNSATGILRAPGPKLDGILIDLASEATDLIGFDTGTEWLQSLKGNASKSTGDLPEGAEVSQGAANNSSQSFTQASNQSAGVQSTDDKSYGTKDAALRNIQDQISIRIGNIAFFESCVITHVQKTYETMIEETSLEPFYARVSIRFKPLFMILRHDLARIFAPPTPGGSRKRGETPNITGPGPQQLPGQTPGLVQTMPVALPGPITPTPL